MVFDFPFQLKRADLKEKYKMNAEQPKYDTRLVYQPRGFRRILKILLILLGIAAAIAFGSKPVFAQDSSPTPQKTQPDKSQPDDSKSTAAADSDKGSGKKKQDDPNQPKKEKRGSWVIAPIPVNSPAFGAGLILGAGYIFKLNKEDTLSPPSTIGAAAAFTNNGSRGLVIAGRLYFDENRYQTTVAIGTGKANYDFYGIGRIPGQPPIAVSIEQKGAFFFAEFMRNIGWNTYIGPRYQYRKLTAAVGDRTTPGGFEIPAIDLKSTTAAIGFHVQRDTRDHTFYPRKGALLDFKGDFFAKPLGSNRNYQTYGISYNGYHSLGKRQVLAYRGTLCSVSDNTPFFDLCLYGAKGDIRGYTAGEFQNHRMFAAQTEFRQELPWRLGIVGFAGFGGVARHWDKFRFDQLLPGAGVGLRFKLDKANHVNYRIDLGFGRAGHTLTFSVTEAF
jgi:hypothetical protein